MILLVIYLKGLIVSFIYDLSLYFCGLDPWGGRGHLFKILDVVFWPFTIVFTFCISVFLRIKGVKPLK